jgi:hypothetical protein
MPPGRSIGVGRRVEFDRVAPPGGNVAVCGKQFWLGPHRAGLTVRSWADEEIIPFGGGE